MAQFISTSALARKWEFTDDAVLFDEVIDKYQLPFLVKFSGNVRPSDKPDAEPFLISGPVQVREWKRHSDMFPHVLRMISVAATSATRSQLGDSIKKYDGSSSWLCLDTPFSIGTDELLLKQHDIQNFEESNGLVSSPSDREEGQMTTREKNSLLRLVAVLSKMYIDQKASNELGTSDEPNISEVIKDIHKYVDLNDLSNEGLSYRTLLNRLNEAFDRS